MSSHKPKYHKYFGNRQATSNATLAFTSSDCQSQRQTSKQWYCIPSADFLLEVSLNEFWTYEDAQQDKKLLWENGSCYPNIMQQQVTNERVCSSSCVFYTQKAQLISYITTHFMASNLKKHLFSIPPATGTEKKIKFSPLQISQNDSRVTIWYLNSRPAIFTVW